MSLDFWSERGSFVSLSLAGIRFSTFHGHFMLRSSDLLALPAVDVDKAFAMELSLEETLLTSPTVYFQVAVLYPLLQRYGLIDHTRDILHDQEANKDVGKD